MDVKFDPHSQISSTEAHVHQKLILPLVESGISQSTTPAVVTSVSMGVPYGHREVCHENLLTRDDRHACEFCSYFPGNECYEHD